MNSSHELTHHIPDCNQLQSVSVKVRKFELSYGLFQTIETKISFGHLQPISVKVGKFQPVSAEFRPKSGFLVIFELVYTETVYYVQYILYFGCLVY